MITLNENWKAAFSQSGVEPIVHIRILDLDTFTDSTCDTVNTSAQITCSTTAALVEGMTVTGDDIPSGAFIVSIDEPATPGGVGTKFTISEAATGNGSGVTLTFGKVYQMTTGDFNRRPLSPRFRADPIILNIVPVSSSMDHWKREPQIGELSVEIADEGTFRRLIDTLNYTLKECRVEVRVGAFGLDLVDYQVVFLGVLFDFLASDGVITLSLRDSFQRVLGKITRKPWYNTHPLIVIKNILNEIGIPDDDIDTDSFDPDHSSHASIGHYCVTGYVSLRYQNDNRRVGQMSGPVKYDTSAEEQLWPHNGGSISVPSGPIIKELSRSMYGFVHRTSNGLIQFRRYDASFSPVRHLTVNDYSSYNQLTNSADIINDVQINIGYGATGNKERVQEFRLRNEASITSHGEHPIELGQLPYSATMSYAFLTGSSPLFSSTDTSLTVFAAQTNGLAGVRGAVPGPQGTNATVSVGRPIHLLNGSEIISATSVSTSVSSSPSDQVWFPSFDSDGGFQSLSDWDKAPNKATISGMTRGVKSTTAEAIQLSDGTSRSDRPWEHFGQNREVPEWWTNPLWDISMIYDHATEILKRYQDGLPTIQLTVSLDHYDLDLGDFITLDATDFVHANLASLDSGTRWEIIGKESVFFGDSLGITLTCAFVNVNVPLGTIKMPPAPPVQFGNLTRPLGDFYVSNAVSGVCVISGLEVEDAGSSKVEISPGIYSSGGRAQSLSEIKSGTLPANSECYVGINDLGFITLSSVGSGADAPPTCPGEVRLAKVFTGSGGSVSSVLDLRQIGGISSRNISGDSSMDNLGFKNANFSLWSRGPTHAPDNWHHNEGIGTFQAKWGQGLIARSGRFSLLSKGGGTSVTSSDIVSAVVPIEPSTHYRITLWAKAGAIDETFNFYFEQFSSIIANYSVQVDLGKGSSVAIGSLDWEPFVLFVETAGGSTYGRIRLVRPVSAGAVGDEDMYFDSFAIDKISPHFTVRKATVPNPSPPPTDLPLSGTQTFLNPTGATKVTWDIVDADTGGLFSLANDQVKTKKEGLYSFEFSLVYRQILSTDPTLDAFFGLYVSHAAGGGGYIKKVAIPEIEDSNDRTATLSVDSVHLLKGDVVEVFFSGASGQGIIIVAEVDAVLGWDYMIHNFFTGKEVPG